MDIDWTKIKQVYFVGIKGSGMIALVQIIQAKGIKVTGSDTKEKFFTNEILSRLGINYHLGFKKENIKKDIDLVIYSTAYNKENNVEVAEAQKKRLKLKSYPEMLAYLFNQKTGIAVAGTHGKTTTASLLAETLKQAGTHPSAVIGSQVIDWGGNALIGQGKYFVAETDEYQNKLRFYNPQIVVLTSIDWDHPDFFKTFAQYKETFKKFIQRISQDGFLVVWGDNQDTKEIAQFAQCQVITYGFSPICDYKISSQQLVNLDQKTKIQEFTLVKKKKKIGVFRTKLVGRHNLLNEAAVIAVACELGLDLKKVKEASLKFKGTKRRLEYIGKIKGKIIWDDYAHHPKEIQTTLAGIRQLYPQEKIWAVFQPHTFTRTKALLNEFSQSFASVDKVIILDIYGSAREVKGGVHSQDLVKLINKSESKKAQYIASKEEAIIELKKEVNQYDKLITLGAGDVWEIGEELKK